MYYGIDFVSDEIFRVNDLDGLQPNSSCDWFQFIKLQYGKDLILGHDHNVGAGKPESDTYYEGIEKDWDSANAQVAFLLSQNDGIRIYKDQEEAIEDLENLIDEFGDNPDQNDMDAIAAYRKLIEQIKKFED